MLKEYVQRRVASCQDDDGTRATFVRGTGWFLPLDEEQARCIHNATTVGNATEEGNRLLFLLARGSQPHAVVRVTESSRHRYRENTPHGLGRTARGRTSGRDERSEEGRKRKRKRKKAKRGRPQRECTGNRIGVVRNIIYTVGLS